jgi:hypothetical protein
MIGVLSKRWMAQECRVQSLTEYQPTVGGCMKSTSQKNANPKDTALSKLSYTTQFKFIKGMIKENRYGKEYSETVLFLCKELIKEPTNKDTLSPQRSELIGSISDYFQKIPELKETELEELLNLFDHTGFPWAYSGLEKILNSHSKLWHVVYEFAQTRSFNTLNSIWGRVLDMILVKPYLSLDDGELQSLDNKLVEAIQGGSIKNEIVDHVKAYLKYKFSLGKKSTTELMDCIFVKVKNYLENNNDVPSLFDACVEIEEEFHDQFKSRYLHLLDQLRQKKKPELKKSFCQYTRRYSISHKEIPHQFKEKLEKFAKDKSSFTLSEQAKQVLQDLISASPPIKVIPIENYPKPKDANPDYYSHSLLVQRPSPIKPITAEEILVVLSSSEKLSEESLSRLAPRKLHPESQSAIVEATKCLVAEWCIQRETRKQVETQIKSFFRFLASPPKDYTQIYKNDLLIKCWSLLNPELKNALDPTEIIERTIFGVEEKRKPRSSSFSSNQNPVTLHDLSEKLLEIAETKTSYPGQHRALAGNLLKQVAYSILADERKEEKTIELLKKLDETYKCISKSEKSYLVAAKMVKQAILEWICLLYKDDYPITLLSALKKGKILVSLDYLSLILDENPHINIRSLYIWQLIATILNQSSDVFHLFKQHYFQLRYCIREDKLQEKIEVDEEFLSSFTDYLPMKHLCNISFYYSSNQNERYILIQIKDDYLAWRISYDHQQQLQSKFTRLGSRKAENNIDLSETFSSVFEEMIQDKEYKHLFYILDNDTDTEQFIQDLKLKFLKIIGAETPAKLPDMQLSEVLGHNITHGYISARYRQDFHKIRSNKSLHVEGSDLHRPDLLCISKDKKHAIIFEFKFSQDANCSKNSPASALLQITEQYISHPYWRDAGREHSHRTSVQYILAVGLEFHFVNGRCDILKQIKRFARDEDRNFKEIDLFSNFPTFIHKKPELHLKLLRLPGMLTSQIQKILQEFSSHNFPNQQRELFEGVVMGILASLLRTTHFKRLSNVCGGYVLKEEEVGWYAIRVADNNKVRWDSLESSLREAAGQWSPLLKQAPDADELKENSWCFVLAMENQKRGDKKVVKVVIGAFRLGQPDDIRIYHPDDHACYLEHQLSNSSSANSAEDAAVLEVTQQQSLGELSLPGQANRVVMEGINQLRISQSMRESSSKRSIDMESEITSVNKKPKIAYQSLPSADVFQQNGFFATSPKYPEQILNQELMTLLRQGEAVPKDNNKVELVFTDLNAAEAFQQQLMNVGIYFVEPGYLCKIELPKDSNNNDQNQFVFTLTEAEYNAIYGDDEAYIRLVSGIGLEGTGFSS